MSKFWGLHICLSTFSFSIIKTYDENSGVTNYLYTQNVIHKIISLPKLSYKTNTLSGMSIVTKTMNQIGPCVYTRYNENMYKKHTTHKSLNSDNENSFSITLVLKNKL